MGSKALDKLKIGCILSVKLEFDLESQSQSPPKNYWDLNKVFYTYGSNLVIVAWTGPELSCGNTRNWHTDWHTDTQTLATTIPGGQNWPRVKMRVLQSKPLWTLSTIHIFLSTVNTWNVNCARATAFIFDTRPVVLVKLSKILRQKMSRPEGDSNPQPSDSCRML